MNGGDWEKKAEGMSGFDRRLMMKALCTLDTWSAFRRECGWTGYKEVEAILARLELRKGGADGIRP